MSASDSNWLGDCETKRRNANCGFGVSFDTNTSLGVIIARSRLTMSNVSAALQTAINIGVFQWTNPGYTP